MAKHPVPKRKTPASKTRSRHSTWRNKMAKYWEDKAKVVKCTNCGENVLAHNLCLHCGQFKGRQIVSKNKGDDNIKVIKA